MIDYVSGTLAEKKLTVVIIDVQGLGYRLLIPTSTYEVLPPVGQPVKLFAYQHVREDALQLFGFATKAEREMFTVMIGVSGVGPKLALAALSAMSPAELRGYVLDGDSGFLTHIPGVGRKTAERLIIELRDRLAPMAFDEMDAAPLTGGSETRAAARADALAALETLGLSRAGAEKSLRKVLRAHPGIQTADELIRMALRES